MTGVKYYSDEVNDDFAEGDEELRVIGAEYKYDHKNPLWHIVAFISYYLFVVPVGYLHCKINFGLRIKGRKNIRAIKGGCYAYGNHTSWIDSFVPSFLAWPKRAFIITGPRAVSLSLLPIFAPMLGAVPLNTTEKGKKSFREFLKNQVGKGRLVAIFPEAHLWPYYNKIRQFSERSFTYPINHNIPVVGYVLTYRQRKLFKNWPPAVTITVGKPIYRNEWKNKSNPKLFLRNKILKFMRDTVKSEKSFEYIKYRKK